MNFIRGAGINGLSGMDYQTNFKLNSESKYGFKIIRPLLDCWRKEILKYLHDNKLEYCYDQTNKDIKFTRNYIRHKIIPQFRKINSSFEENILAQANTLRLLKKQIDKNTHKIIESAKISKNGVEFSLGKWNQLDDFYKRETILALIRKVDSAKDIYRSQIEEFIDLLVNSSSGSFKMLPNSLVLYKNYDKIIISLKDQLLKKFKIKRQKLTISGTTVLAESENKIRTKFIRKIGRIPNKGMIVDYKKTGDKIFVRSRKNGDYFKPIGLRGRKKIQDFLVDQKIPKFERDCVPVLTNGKDQIIGLLGLRQDQRFSADGKARKILLIELI
jgi:tRNA(Ile)-lysidine synthase